MLRPEERKKVLSWIETTFGIPSTLFNDLVLFERGKDVWITTEEALKLNLPQISRRGVRFCRKIRGRYRLISTAVLTFGSHATKQVWEVKRGEAERFLRGEDIKVSLPSDIKPGQVIIRFMGIPLGSGLLIGDRIKNQVPVSQRVRSPIERGAS